MENLNNITYLKEIKSLENSTNTKYKHNDVAMILLENKNNSFYLFDNELYYYSCKNVYISNLNELEYQIIRINPGSTISFRREVPAYLKILLQNDTKSLKDEVNTNYINFKNGLFNLKTGKLEKHSKEIFTINQLNVNYRDIASLGDNSYKEAELVVNKFLDDISCHTPERKQALLEMIGYILTSSTCLQKSFILYGTGANGKSTFTDLIQNILGHPNCTSMSLTEIITDRFALARLKNIQVNICEEMTTKSVKDSSVLKNIITATRLSSRDLYKQGEEKHNYTRFIFNVNEFPNIADSTEGLYRRFHVIPFKAHFTSNSANGFNKNALFSDKAKEYLTYISLKAYLEMINNSKDFSNKNESDKIIALYKNQNDSISTFITDPEDGLNKIIKNGNNIIKRSDFYFQYTLYCKLYNLSLQSKQKLYKVLKDTPYNKFITSIIKDGYNFYKIEMKEFAKYLENTK